MTASPPPGTPEDVVRVDFRFKRELAEKIEGDLAGFRDKCGACGGDRQARS